MVTPALGGAPSVDPNAVFAPIYRRGDRWMMVFVAVHLVLAAVLAPAAGTWTAAAIGGGSALLFFASAWLRPGSLWTRCVAGLVLQAFCALHIYQMNGLAEMHFFFFTSVTALIIYEDWRALWPGVVAIIAQHTLFSYWHNTGAHVAGHRFFEPEHVTVLKLTFHFGIALAQVAVASYWARTLREQTLADATQRRTLEHANRLLETQRTQLEEQGAALAAANARLQEQAVELEATNAHLHDQAMELELTNEHLQDQATELEAQAEHLRATTDELLLQREEREALLEAAREAQAAAEAANEAKSIFLATMSHELRTPLNAVAGYADLLALGIHGPVTDGQQGAIGRIKRSGQHLLALINDILNFAKLEAGRVEFRAERVVVEDLVGEVEELIAAQAAARGIACARAASPAGLRMLADDEKARQILLNLLTNAVKFTAPGGTITLGWAEATSARGAPVVRLSVRDTGRGIPADQLERVFEPFVQVDRHLTQESQQGVGLGLAISRDLARGMGGDLTVTSVVGEGSEFALALPRV